MTTPGGGDGNEIVIRTSVQPDPNGPQVARRAGEESAAAFAQGVASGPAPALKGLDADALFRSLDSVLTQAENRVATAARNMGTRLQEAVGGHREGLFGQDFQIELERYRNALESYGGEIRPGSTFVGRFADALRHDIRILEQGYDALSLVNRKGKSINWAFNEEGRRFISQAGQRTSESDTTGFFKELRFPQIPVEAKGPVPEYHPGDLERIRAAGMESIQRVMLDDATYAVEHGQFFRTSKTGSVLRAKGPIEDQALLARLHEVTTKRFQEAITASGNQILSEHASRTVAADITGINPAQRYGLAGTTVSGQRLLETITPQVTGGFEGLVRVFGALERSGLEDTAVLQRLSSALYEQARAAGAAASATRLQGQRSEQAARQSRLEAQLAQDRIQASERFTRLTQFSGIGRGLSREDIAAGLYPGAGGGGGRPPRPPAPPTGPPEGPDDENSFYRKQAAIQQAAIANANQRAALRTYQENFHATAQRTQREEEVSAKRALFDHRESARVAEARAAAAERELGVMSHIGRVTQESFRPGQPTVLDPDAYRRLAESGSIIGRDVAARLPTGGIGLFDRGGDLRQAISLTEALNRAQRDAAQVKALQARGSESVAAAAAQETEQIARMSQAQVRAFITTKELAEAERKYKDALASNDPLAAAQARLRFAEAQQAATPTAQRGFLGNVAHGIFGPSRGGEDRGGNAFVRLRSDSGEFLGAIARYQAAYAVIFGLSQAFGSLLRNEVALQDTMVEFADATGLAGNKAKDLVGALGEIGGPAGFSVAQSITAATRGIYAFSNELGTATGESGGDERAALGRESTRVAGMVALLAATGDANTLQQQLIATTKGFNLTAYDQVRALDAVVNAHRNYGVEIADILQGLPAVANVSREAGLSLEETANIVAAGIQGSGLGGTGVASLVNRFIGNFNERPETRTLLTGFGVDTSGTAGQVLQNLAGSWDQLTKAQRNATITALGGHEVAKVLLPILEKGDYLLQANAKSYEKSGAAAEKYQERLNNISGLLRTIGGDLQNVGHALAQAGFLTALGAALATIHPLLQGVGAITSALEKMNSLSHGLAIPFIEIATVLFLIGRTMEKNLVLQAGMTAGATAEASARTVGGVAGLFGIGRAAYQAQRASRVAEAAPALSGLLGPNGAPLAATAGAASGGRLAAAGAAGARSVGALAGALVGPLGLTAALVGVTVAVGGTVEALRRQRAANEQSKHALDALAGARTPDQYQTAASVLADAAQAQREAESGFFGGFVLRHSRPEGVAEGLERQQRFAAAEAGRLRADQAAAAETGKLNTFFASTGDRAKDLAEGLAAMDRAGVPAVRQLDLLGQALNELGKPRTAGGQVFGTRATVDALGAGVLAAFSQGAGTIGQRDTTTGESKFQNEDAWDQLNWLGSRINPFEGFKTAGERAREQAQATLRAMDPEKINKTIQDVLGERGVGPGQAIDSDTQTAIENAVIKLVPEDMLTGEAQQRIITLIRQSIGKTFGDLLSTGPAIEGMSQSEFDTFVRGDETHQSLEQYLGSLSRHDDPRKLDSGLGRQKGTVARLQQIYDDAIASGKTGDQVVAVLELLNKAKQEFVEARIAQLERVRDVALSKADTPAEVAKANRDFQVGAATAAIKAGSETALVAALEGATKGTIATVRGVIEKAIADQKAAIAAYKAYQAQLATFLALGPAARHDPDYNLLRPGPNPGAPDPETLKGLQGLLNSLNTSVSSGGGSKEDPTARIQAQINARHRAGDAVAAARDARDAARAALAGAENATERAQALRQLKDAEYAYRQALQQYGAALRAASVRAGDPLSQARAALANAAAALRVEAKGTTAYYQALAQYHEAQYAYRQALLERQHNLRLLNIDITNDVAVAKEELKAAQAKLASDQKHGTGDTAADRLAVRQAQANLEAAQFQQRLGDVQVAHELGKISDAAYLAYLQSEHDRLTNIANKTRQQIDQLNQIDLAIKAANEALQGQFNIGDIRVPTVYEVRRSLAAQTASTQALVQQSISNSITINGADLVQVKALLTSLLGPLSTQSYSTTTRKV